MKSKIIYAKPEHLFHIMAVLEDGLLDSMPYFPKIETPFIYHEIIDLTARGMAAVAIIDSKIVGFAAIDENAMPWAPSGKFFNNKFYIVMRDYRASDAGAQLLEAMKRIAFTKRAALVVSVNSGTDAERKITFLEKKGGIIMGANMLFRPPADQGDEQG